MRYIAFLELFKDFTIFSLNDIRSVDPNFHRRRLNEWQDKGYVKKVIKGYYMLSDVPLNEDTLFDVANRIYSPSYVSFEMALSYYGFIPEAVYGITSVSTRVTRTFSTHLGEFIYHTLHPRFFFGYTTIGYGTDKHYTVASPEKAVLDHFYINPSLRKPDDFESLRFNRDTFFSHVKEPTLFEYLDRFRQKTLSIRINSFWRFMKDA